MLLTCLVLVMEGMRDDVHDAERELLILQVEDEDDESAKVPNHWIPQEDNLEISDIAPNSPEWLSIERKMRESIPDVAIQQIHRIQNLRLWKSYVFQREKVQTEIKDQRNAEAMLFHGTYKLSPAEIYDGDCGFDMRFASESNLWGKGEEMDLLIMIYSGCFVFDCSLCAHSLIERRNIRTTQERISQLMPPIPPRATPFVPIRASNCSTCG